jgi:hypothetical protein
LKAVNRGFEGRNIDFAAQSRILLVTGAAAIWAAQAPSNCRPAARAVVVVTAPTGNVKVVAAAV